MKQHILYLFTRTPLHVGAGSSVGAIDQPVQRERHTGFPIIPGSSIKGVFRDHIGAMDDLQNEVDKLFGYSANGDEPGRSGSISFSEAKLLAFPLRSARGCYALTTCPLALERYSRSADLKISIPSEPGEMHCLAGSTVVIDGKALVLEEYRIQKDGEFPQEWATHLAGLLDDAVLKGAINRFVLLSNGDFAHFAANACQVNQHVGIDDKTGTQKKGALFNEETVPSETLFFSALTELRYEAEKSGFIEKLKQEQLIQFGGDGTTGLGYCTVKLA